MGLTRQWLETKPAVTDKIKDGPAEFQARWKDIRELLNSAGIVCDGANPLAEQGLHAVLASGIASPDIYKADRATKILAFTDAAATLLADYPLNGTRNIPEATVADDVIGNQTSPTTGFKRAVKPLRIFESSPVDTKVNVRPGTFTKTGGFTIGLYAGGFLTIGVAPLTLPAAGNHAYYAIHLTGAGVLTAVKGTEVILASTPTAPDFPARTTPIAVIEIKDTSANFSLAASGANAFLITDARLDSPIIEGGGLQVAQGITGSVGPAAAVTLRASKAITTSGNVVIAFALAFKNGGFGGNHVTFGRSGAASIYYGDLSVSDERFYAFGAEALAAGTYTYELRTDSTGAAAPDGVRIILIESTTTVLG